jgi:glycosyltransferase involved in cell wall biosynthesis
VSVSVVLPNRNHGETLKAAIRSAAAQNPVEVVVIDDASEDNSVDVIGRMVAEFPCVRMVRWESKSPDWQAAVATVFPTLRGDHVMVMAADDELADGVVDSANWHRTAAVVFHDYVIRRPKEKPFALLSMGAKTPEWYSPDQFCCRLMSTPNATETGIGSSIKKDHLLWLVGMRYWEMGPWSDAIGYAVVGAKYGGSFCPGVGAVFTVDDNGYGATHRDGPRQAEYHEACRQFVANSGLPNDVGNAILRRRQVNP